MKLDGEQRKQFHEALLDAFPKVEDFEKAVSFGMNLQLSEIASGGSTSDIYFRVIEWAEARQQQIENLVVATVKANPDNIKLNEFKQRVLGGKLLQNTSTPEDNFEEQPPISSHVVKVETSSCQDKSLDGNNQAIKSEVNQYIMKGQDALKIAEYLISQRTVSPKNIDKTKVYLQEVESFIQNLWSLLYENGISSENLIFSRSQRVITREGILNKVSGLQEKLNGLRSNSLKRNVKSQDEKMQIKNELQSLSRILGDLRGCM